MKNECSVIKDILPLYAENMISDDTREFIETHINTCENCKNELNILKSDTKIQNDYPKSNDGLSAMKKVVSSINKKRFFTASLSAIISAIIIITLFSFLTAPEYIPYSETEKIVSVKEIDATVNLSFTGEYELISQELGVYEISVYNTLWNRIFGYNKKQSITVNPNSEKVNTIYYVSNGKIDDTVIYGENPNSNGGTITLPRIFLNSYFTLAVFSSIVLAILLLITRKKEKLNKIIKFLFFAPVSYSISHILITGLNASTYSPARDFSLICLVTILIYFVFYIIFKKKNYK